MQLSFHPGWRRGHTLMLSLSERFRRSLLSLSQSSWVAWQSVGLPCPCQAASKTFTSNGMESVSALSAVLSFEVVTTCNWAICWRKRLIASELNQVLGQLGALWHDALIRFISKLTDESWIKLCDSVTVLFACLCVHLIGPNDLLFVSRSSHGNSGFVLKNRLINSIATNCSRSICVQVGWLFTLSNSLKVQREAFESDRFQISFYGKSHKLIPDPM